MVLAAGLGKRLRPITETTPKPLVPVAGRPMLDRTLDAARAGGIERAVVNVHHLGAQIIAHCAGRTGPAVTISDERERLLETAGGIVKALPLLGRMPFALLNADTFWIDGGPPTLKRMIDHFDARRMDMLLLLAKPGQASGHSGGIDFIGDETGRISWSPDGATDGFIYAGAAVLDPRIFGAARAEPHSLHRYFDRAMARGRLFGLPLENGHWYTVGTPRGLAEVEAHLAAHAV